MDTLFRWFVIVSMLVTFASSAAWAGEVTNLKTFNAGDPAVADEVNANFSAVKTAVDDNDSRITTNTDTINTLNAPKTDYYSLSSWAVSVGPVSDFQGEIDSEVGLYWKSGTLGHVDFAIDLPHNAEIKEFEVYVYDSNATWDIYVLFLRSNLNAPALGDFLADAMSSGATGSQTLTYALDPVHVVDKSTYGYYVNIFFPEPPGDNTIGFKGLRVTYIIRP